MEGQALRDNADEFQRRNTVILGASFDTIEENRAFADDQGFPFRLLSDTDRVAGFAYSVTRDADDQYAEYPKRISYLIAPGGTIARAYAVSDVAGHAAEVLADLDQLLA